MVKEPVWKQMYQDRCRGQSGCVTIELSNDMHVCEDSPPVLSPDLQRNHHLRSPQSHKTDMLERAQLPVSNQSTIDMTPQWPTAVAGPKAGAPGMHA